MKAVIPANDRELADLLALSILQKHAEKLIRLRTLAANTDCKIFGDDKTGRTKKRT